LFIAGSTEIDLSKAEEDALMSGVSLVRDCGSVGAHNVVAALPSRMLELTRDDAYAVGGSEATRWISRLVDERLAGSVDGMSMMTPIRKPSRIPFFTQALVRQPPCELVSGSAERTSPRFSASLNSQNILK
jgi:hypothetical protein